MKKVRLNELVKDSEDNYKIKIINRDSKHTTFDCQECNSDGSFICGRSGNPFGYEVKIENADIISIENDDVILKDCYTMRLRADFPKAAVETVDEPVTVVEAEEAECCEVPKEDVACSACGNSTTYSDGRIDVVLESGEKKPLCQDCQDMLNEKYPHMSYGKKIEKESESQRKLSVISSNLSEITEAWSQAPSGWNTWVSVDLEKKEVATSYQSSSTVPGEYYREYEEGGYRHVMSLPYIYNVADVCDDGTGHCEPDDLRDDVMDAARKALGLEN